MRWWETVGMVVLVIIAVLLKGVPMSEWARWRLWFRPNLNVDNDGDSDDDQRPRTPD